MSEEQSTEEGAEQKPGDWFGGLAWPHKVELSRPIVFGKGEAITELVFQRGNLGTIKGMRVDIMPTLDEQLLIASRMCGKPVAALYMLDADDSSEVLAIALGFFGRCLADGKKR